MGYLIRTHVPVKECHGANRTRGGEFRVLVTFDASGGTERIADGPLLSRKTLVQILQSARVGVAVTTADGEVYAGEVTRTLPRRLRREILLRDRRCQYPGCRNDVHIDVHHKVYRSRGGTHDRANLAALCAYHHRFVHRNNITLEYGEDDRIQAQSGLTMLTLFGVASLTFMMVMYALERRGSVFVLGFAIGCALSSAYGFLAGAWPFGAIEAIWCAVALRRFRIGLLARPENLP